MTQRILVWCVGRFTEFSEEVAASICGTEIFKYFYLHFLCNYQSTQRHTAEPRNFYTHLVQIDKFHITGFIL